MTGTGTTRTPARRASRGRALPALLALACAALPLRAQPAPRPESPGDHVSELPSEARGLDITEHLGQPLPMELEFTNSEGKPVHLGDYFKGNRPAVIAMVYYDCPVVCTTVMEKLFETVNELDLTLGKDYQVLIFSFNHTETTQKAAGLRDMHLAGYNRPVDDRTRAACEFHTGSATAARRLADALGFKYRILENGQFSHPVGIFVATPEGKISRYLYGFSYPARDMKLALLEASSGRIGSSFGDRIMNFCYMYDPKKGSYTLQAMRVMQVGGVITLAVVAGLVGGLFALEKVRRAAARKAASPAANVTRHDAAAPTGAAHTGMVS